MTMMTLLGCVMLGLCSREGDASLCLVCLDVLEVGLVLVQVSIALRLNSLA